MPPIPGPIRVAFTLKEAASLHLTVTSILRVFDEAGHQLHDRPVVERAAGAIERELRKAGCVFDGDGWMV